MLNENQSYEICSGNYHLENMSTKSVSNFVIFLKVKVSEESDTQKTDILGLEVDATLSSSTGTKLSKSRMMQQVPHQAANLPECSKSCTLQQVKHSTASHTRCSKSNTLQQVKHDAASQ